MNNIKVKMKIKADQPPREKVNKRHISNKINDRNKADLYNFFCLEINNADTKDRITNK